MPFGNKKGREVFPQLKAIIDSNPNQNVFEISFDGIEFTDSSFARESILLLAKMFRGNKGIFYLILIRTILICLIIGIMQLKKLNNQFW